MLKKLMLLLMVFLLSSVYALEVEVTPVINKIYPDEHADFKLLVINDKNAEQTFSIYSPDISWYVDLEPSDLTVDKNSENEYVLSIVPSAWAGNGPNLVNVIIKSGEEKFELQLPVYLKSYEDSKKEYAASLELEVTFPEKIDPRNDIPVEVYIRNRNKLDIKLLKIHIYSSYFEEYSNITLGPQEERKENYLFRIDKRTEPAESNVYFELIYGNRTLNKEKKPLIIVPYADFEKKEDTIKEFFKTTTEYTITNNGNYEKTGEFSIDANLLQLPFLISSPGPSSKVLSKGKVVWELTLKPDEEKVIIVSENYRLIVYVILLFALVGIMYFIYRSPIVVKKEAIILGSPEQGISELKVMIHIRNRSSELIENVMLTDLLPTLAEVEKEIHIGSISPIQILKNDRKGSLIKWQIEAIEPFEERIVTYKARTKMIIIGGLTLPAAKARFKAKTGNERIVKSNKAILSVGI